MSSILTPPTNPIFKIPDKRIHSFRGKWIVRDKPVRTEEMTHSGIARQATPFDDYFWPLTSVSAESSLLSLD